MVLFPGYLIAVTTLGGAALLRPSTLSSVLGGVLLLCLTSEGFARPQVESLELDHSGAEASAAVMTW